MKHLTSEEVSACMLGQPSPMAAQHIEDCPACRAEVANYSDVLAEFRGSVRAWSQDQANAALAMPPAVQNAPSWMASHQLAWALLIAAVCIVASFVHPWYRSDRTSSSDTVLLNQVDGQVSRTVPSSMEPLMKLVVQE
jgi:anti-sigma factor RsiW